MGGRGSIKVVRVVSVWRRWVTVCVCVRWLGCRSRSLKGVVDEQMFTINIGGAWRVQTIGDVKAIREALRLETQAGNNLY